MSYDYNAILQSINQNRRKAYKECSASPSYPSSETNARNTISNVDIDSLNQVVEDYATLSSHCPLPPMLWLQYACDAGVLMENLLSSSNENEVSGDGVVNRSQIEEEESTNRKQISESRLGILGAGLEEFPGCKLLRRWYLDELLRDYRNSCDTYMDISGEEQKIWKAFQEAIGWVCEGSYYQEKNYGTNDDSSDIRSIWEMAIQFLMQSKSFSNKDVKECFIQRSKMPMIGLNDELRDKISAFPELANDAEFLEQIENGRRAACKKNQHMGPWEDEVSEAMEQEGIYNSDVNNKQRTRIRVYGENIFLRTHQHDEVQQQQYFLMGLGGQITANAFLKFIKNMTSSSTSNPKHLKTESDPKTKTQNETIHLVRVFERAISECPTVELLWVNYIQFLLTITKSSPNILSPDVLLDACHRSVRNCPYSATLFKLQMHCRTLDLFSEIDLDSLLEIAKVSTEAKFLPSPEACLDVHMEVPRVIRRRLFKVLSINNSHSIPPYDVSHKDLEKAPSALFEKGPNINSPDKVELVHDIIDDMREAFDAADLYVRKNHHNWNLGRAKLWKERAATESRIIYSIHLQFPPDSELQEEENHGGRKRKIKPTEEEIALEGKVEKEAVKCYEKLVRIHPKFVDGWREYIAFVLSVEDGNSRKVIDNDDIENVNIVEKFRRIRGLYHRAIKAAGDTVTDDSSSLGEISLNKSSGVILCQDFLNFEQNYGSLESIKNATNLIRLKLRKLTNSITTPSLPIEELQPQSETDNKRSLDEIESNIEPEENDMSTANKKRKLEKDAKEDENFINSVENDIPKPTNLKVVKPLPHFVQIGKMSYPAHPFTIHVSNLSPGTEDMDLVDTFKKCGAIVHAKILRLKSSNPKQRGESKQRGLIQFEEKESVNEALRLSENIGMHERLVKVERSHCAAIGLIPSGMHRINPKGGGKRSKINEMKKSRTTNEKVNRAEKVDDMNGKGSTKSIKPKDEKSRKGKEEISKLAFFPRGLTNRNLKKKRLKLP